MKSLMSFIVLVLTASLMGCGGEESPSIPERSTEEHTEEELVTIPLDKLAVYGVEVDTAGPGWVSVVVELPGEIKVNADRLVHVVPRVSGIVRQAYYTVGDEVRRGARMAWLESRELADLQAEYLAAWARYEVAQANYRREERLFAQGIASEQEFLEAKQQFEESSISLRTARRKLLALGFSTAYVDSLPSRPEEQLARYDLRAPLSGIIVDRHLALGEALEANDIAFTIADLRKVWVDLSVYPRDLPRIQAGQKVTIQVGYGLPPIQTRIRFVRPILGEETRTAIARTIVDNPQERYKPGTFVTARVEVDRVQGKVVVPTSAVLTMEGQSVVFIYTEEGFRPTPVTLGVSNDVMVEITSGLEPGDIYVRKGGFVLRAELEKSEMGEGHGH